MNYVSSLSDNTETNSIETSSTSNTINVLSSYLDMTFSSLNRRKITNLKFDKLLLYNKPIKFVRIIQSENKIK